MDRRYEVVVIGGGQAGLAMGYHLARQGRDFVILDAAPRTGDSWRTRWDSLTLFTPARFSGLPRLPFPGDPDHFPGKDEVASYLELYARRFDLPIRSAEAVISLGTASGEDGFEIRTAQAEYRADQVIVATGPFQKPAIPALAAALPGHVVQLHSSAYRSPAQLPPDGELVVVGGGNSGVQIAAELSASRRTSLAVGRNLPRLPERWLGRSIFWWLEKLGYMDVTVGSRLGRRLSARDGLIGQSPEMVARDFGVRLVGRVERVEGGRLSTGAGERVDAAAVIWATGFRPDFGWVDAPVLNEAGWPVHVRGVTRVPGLYFLGLPWQHTRGSALIGWVGRDAAYLADRVEAHRAEWMGRGGGSRVVAAVTNRGRGRERQ